MVCAADNCTASCFISDTGFTSDVYTSCAATCVSDDRTTHAATCASDYCTVRTSAIVLLGQLPVHLLIARLVQLLVHPVIARLVQPLVHLTIARIVQPRVASDSVLVARLQRRHPALGRLAPSRGCEPATRAADACTASGCPDTASPNCAGLIGIDEG